ncbi:MAG: hypothetical protein AAFX54_05215 [Pseudomonadota bacterium]
MSCVLTRRAAIGSGALAAAFSSNGAFAEELLLATEEDVIEVYAVLRQWIETYRAGDYDGQWLLTDSRIRRWHNKRRWRNWMTEAQKNNGDVTTYMVESGAPVRAEDLPCTEQGHCFRQGVQYIIYIMRTEYEKAEPAQPEFAVMAKSNEGWRFGGGTLLNRPLGETAVIMTRQDEARYRPSWSISQ